LRPKLVYVVPNFHNPSGATMSLARRQQLAALADQYDLLIVEDDPYGAIRFAGEPLPPVASFTERVVHLSTFSKIVAPGFRVGWMIGPPEVMSWVARAKQAADLHTSSFAQLLLANVVGQPGWLDEQKARIVPMYRERCVRWPTRSRPRWATASRSTAPTAACSCGRSSRTSRTPRSCCSIRRSREGVAFVPGNAFTIDQVPDCEGPLLVLHAFARPARRRGRSALARAVDALRELDVGRVEVGAGRHVNGGLGGAVVVATRGNRERGHQREYKGSTMHECGLLRGDDDFVRRQVVHSVVVARLRVPSGHSLRVRPLAQRPPARR
jgi:aspartate/methionine/tyrosine aminotransferase